MNTFSEGLRPMVFAIMLGLITIMGFYSCQSVDSKLPENSHADTLQLNWSVQSNDSVDTDGKAISQNSYYPENWFSARVPSTVLNVLMKNGLYHGVFLDNHLLKISKTQFNTSWWYRTSFRLASVSDVYLLKFQGINYKADVWINGKQIADTNNMNNAFKQYAFEVTKYLKQGENSLAVRVFPPKAGDFSIGFVDWNPAAPDHDMGIFRPVILYRNTGVEISAPYVQASLDDNDLSADLHVSLKLKNYLSEAVAGLLKMEVAGKEMQKLIKLKAGEEKVYHFSPADFSTLHLEKPHLWWPHNIGNPYLYQAAFSFEINHRVSDVKKLAFGIRKVASFWTKAGHRGIMINGKKVLVRGGGWVDRLFLDDDTHSLEAQLNYVKDMGLNAIRLEGFWGNSEEMYRLADQKGILILVGWSCQWEWENLIGKHCDINYGAISTDAEIKMISQAWKDQIIWLRNHPSIIAWFSGSDKKPKPDLERNYLEVLKQYDSTRIYLASAKEWSSLAGPTGLKMRGPYAYEPPVYWFADTLFGGAFGFNTETGPGVQVPPLESLKKMFSPNHRWPIDSMWTFHSGRGVFGSIDRYTHALEMRYGKSNLLGDFAMKAQVLNYETMRPMFEAFSARRYTSTGIIQWMLNSAWPELYWQLYDAYLMPNGAYYGAKKANRPLHAVYDYAKNAIFLVNDQLKKRDKLGFEIRILNIDSKIVFEKEITVFIGANTAKEIFRLPEVLSLSKTYFVDLRLFDEKGNEIDNNFYWLSTQKDLLDYKAKVHPWYFYTPTKQYADYRQLNRLPAASVSYRWSQTKNEGKTLFRVALKNTGNKLAFFMHPAIIDRNTGETILPVVWSDNYIPLLPHESRILTAEIKAFYLKDKVPALIIDAYNPIKLTLLNN